MTKRHVEKLAQWLRQERDNFGTLNADQHRILAESLAELCANQNMPFNREKFLAACGID